MASGGVRVKAGTRPPWVGLAAAVWVQMAAGNAYTFPLYSPALKSVLGYDQRRLAMLGVANMTLADFWLLFAGYFIGVGTGVTVLNNLAQIRAAAAIADSTVLLSLFGLGNFLGRLGGGAISEKFVRSMLVLPRPVWMALTQAILVVAYLCLAYALSPGVVYACAAGIGVCYGVQFAVMIPTTSELFGLRNFGLFYNLMSLANPLGAVLFSEELAGRLSDDEAARQRRRRPGHAPHACLGPDCFRVAFVVLAGACAVGTAVSLVLAARIRPVYRALYSGGSFRLPNSSQQH
ncbi:hypothetical protein ACP70R_001444 [Stipagrostis hirtigluma subsp. patula]